MRGCELAGAVVGHHGTPRPSGLSLPAAAATATRPTCQVGSSRLLLLLPLLPRYPVESIRMAVSICRQAEENFDHRCGGGAALANRRLAFNTSCVAASLQLAGTVRCCR